MYWYAKTDNSFLFYCVTTSTSNIMQTIYPFSAVLLLQIIALVIFQISSRKNKNYSTNSATEGSLSTRYQIQENLWTIRMMKVFVYTECVFTIALMGALDVVIFNNANLSMPTYFALIEVSNLMFLYALVLPLILWYKRKDVRTEIRSAVNQNRIGSDYDRVFDVLRSQWDTCPKPSKPARPHQKRSSKVMFSNVISFSSK
ncbi:hypothetical protein Q1695_003689 [Nippostrongylus brasiliensis]|nr:hypothetical protein Q1695_003689 [Nippostrongylus brasiliensis]